MNNRRDVMYNVLGFKEKNECFYAIFRILRYFHKKKNDRNEFMCIPRHCSSVIIINRKFYMKFKTSICERYFG